MMKRLQWILAVVLSLTMVMGCLPTALAEGLVLGMEGKTFTAQSGDVKSEKRLNNLDA